MAKIFWAEDEERRPDHWLAYTSAGVFRVGLREGYWEYQVPGCDWVRQKDREAAFEAVEGVIRQRLSTDA